MLLFKALNAHVYWGSFTSVGFPHQNLIEQTMFSLEAAFTGCTSQSCCVSCSLRIARFICDALNGGQKHPPLSVSQQAGTNSTYFGSKSRKANLVW